MNPKTKNLIQLNAAVLIWGGTAMFAKGIDLPTPHIICLRSAVAAVGLLAFLLFTRSAIRVNRPRHYLLMLILGVLMGAHWLTYFESLKISTAAVAILSLQTYPVFTALIEPLVFREKLHPADVLLAVLVLLGVGVMLPDFDLTNQVTQAIFLGIGSGLLFMSRNLITRKYVRQYSSSMLMFYQTLVIAVLLSPVLLLWPHENLTAANMTWPLVILLGLAFTAFPHVLYSASLTHLRAKTVAIIATLLPFYGAFWGWVCFNEQVNGRTAVGGGMVLACVVIETARSVKK